MIWERQIFPARMWNSVVKVGTPRRTQPDQQRPRLRPVFQGDDQHGLFPIAQAPQITAKILLYQLTRSLEQVMLNLEFADAVLQGLPLTFQFFDFWIQGSTFRAFIVAGASGPRIWFFQA